METKLLVDFNLKKNFKIVLIHKRWFLSNLNIFDDLEWQKTTNIYALIFLRQQWKHFRLPIDTPWLTLNGERCSLVESALKFNHYITMKMDKSWTNFPYNITTQQQQQTPSTTHSALAIVSTCYCFNEIFKWCRLNSNQLIAN